MLREYYEAYPLYLASDAHSVGQLFDDYSDYDELTFPMFDRLRIPGGGCGLDGAQRCYRVPPE